jgi:hypothetical protein
MRRRLPIICVILIGCLTICLIQLQYIFGVLNTPKGMQYLGTVHNASDYFSYLSYMAEGRDHWVTSSDLYTEEAIPRNFSRWEFVLFGHLLYMIHSNLIVGYEIMIFLCLIFFLGASYVFLKFLLPHKPWQQVLAFLLFATATSWPIVTHSTLGFAFGYHTYWYNTGNIIVRFGPTPHHLFAGGLFVCGFIFTLLWRQRHQWWYLVVLSTIACLVVTINPVLWLLLMATVGLASLTAHILEKKSWHIRLLWQNYAPTIAMGAGGLPSALYLQHAFSIPPWTNGAGWEMWQQIYVAPIDIFYGSGLIMIFGLIGILPAAKRHTYSHLLSIYMILICFVCFYTRVSFYLKVTNARFLPPALYVFLGMVASEGILFLGHLVPQWKRVVCSGLVALYLISIIPSHVAQQRELSMIDTNNTLIYATDDMWKSYTYVDENLPKEATYLVQWPFTLQFPALTARKSFFGGSDMTIDGGVKTASMSAFFAGHLSEPQVKEFFTIHPIKYVFAYSNNSAIEKWPYFRQVFRTPQVTIYSVEL